MKLVTTLLLCGAMAAGVFAGCGGRGVKVTGETLQIGVVARGFGSEHVKQLAKAFKEKTGIDAQVVRSTPDDNFVYSSLQMGPGKNEVDLYVTGHINNFKLLAKKGTIVKGYDPIWADLSEVYESTPEGFVETKADPTLKMKQLIPAETYKAVTWTDGNQYAVPYTMGVSGLLYNKTLWDQTNQSLLNNGKSAMSLPKTSKQLFEVFETITNLRNPAKTPSSYLIDAYAFNFSGQATYGHMMFSPWWAQYDGKGLIYNFMEGKDADGNYTPEIFKSTGRLRALENMKNLYTEGYFDPNDTAKDFTKAQLDFLRGRAFFSLNGDWLENEASENFKGEADVAFLPIPLISDIVEKFPADFPGGKTPGNEAKLRLIVDYLDGAAGAADQGISADTLNFLREARKFKYHDQSENLLMHVPAYSKHIDKAKAFLKYMYSKEGQEVMMSSCYGNMCPLKVDPKQFDYYNGGEITVMGKSKIDIFQDANLFGSDNLSTPLMYLTSFTGWRLNGTSFSGAFMQGISPAELQQVEYKYYLDTWTELMKAIGQA